MCLILTEFRLQDNFEYFRDGVGSIFGKDSSVWKPVGQPKVEITEDFENFKKTTKTTGTFAGIKLHLWQVRARTAAKHCAGFDRYHDVCRVPALSAAVNRGCRSWS